jgi:DNA gyrase/topoisomerase IV subunit B
MASSAPSSALRRLLEDRISQLATEAEGILTEARDQERRKATEQLNQLVRRMRQSADSEELAAALVDAVSSFAAGVAFFRLEGDAARGERIRGVAQATTDSFPGLRVSLASAAALAGAVQSRDPVTALATPAEVSAELAALAGHSPEERVTIVPLLVRDDVRALVYTWGGAQIAAIEMLCQVASAVWAGIEPVTVEATPPPAPELVQIAGAQARPRPTWDSLPPAEQQVHLKAQRFARVRAAEMRLHESQDVQTGRTRRDLYGALREPIDGARAKFREEFFANCPSMVDYLHLELVRTLANDDPEALGKEYPGPLV